MFSTLWCPFYTCFILLYIVPAYVSSRPRTVQIKAGSMMALPCRAKGYPSNFTYLWKKDGITINGANQSFLIIYKTTTSDVGHYECFPSNTFGTHNTTEFTVNIESEYNHTT